jgi:Ribbon-helix-helix protein, copG family
MKASTCRKNKGGRPRLDRDPHPSRTIRLSDELVDRVDGWADHEDINRSEAIRRLVELGLKAKAKR